MRYSGIETDQNFRFLKCPVCGNDEFTSEAEFCRICGSAIINFCQDLYDEAGTLVNAGCGKPNPGNARFCEYCGNPTLLYSFLTHWEDEKIHLEKYGEPEDDNSSSDTTVSEVETSSETFQDEGQNEECQNEIENDSSDSTSDNQNISHIFSEFFQNNYSKKK